MTTPIRLLCVDDHQFIVEGLAAMAGHESGIEFAGRLASANDLVAEVERLRPDVVLLDLEMPGSSALEAMAESLHRSPSARFVVLTAHLRDSSIVAALRLGAVGFFSKTDSPESIFQGIRRAARGEAAYGADVAERIAALRSNGDPKTIGTPLDDLSPRELEVLRRIGRGMARADIARALCRSLKTIDAHHTAIMRKLDIHDRGELTCYAIREGLVEA